MRNRLKFGVFAVPTLAQIWISRNSDQENDFLGRDFFYDQCGKWDRNWDGRRAKSLVTDFKTTESWDQEQFSQHATLKKSKANRNIILIRHGQYHDKEKSDDKRQLTEIGREQARATGRRLNELRHAGTMPFTALINSTLQRAIETGDLITEEMKDGSLPALNRTMDSLLCEGAPCPPEPIVTLRRTEAQYLEDGSRIEAAFHRHFYRARPEQEKDSYEMIVCHANVIRYFVCRALQFPPQAWLRLSLAHASITWIVIRPDGLVILRCFGMRYNFKAWFIAPSLAQAWTTLSTKLNDEHGDTLYRYDECGRWDGNWDGRSAKGLVAGPKRTEYWDQEDFQNNVTLKRAKANRNIILIRHGQYHSEATTDDERYLTEKGQKQARATGKRLVELRKSGMPFTNLVNSTMLRAIQTADFIHEELVKDTSASPVTRQADPNLREGLPCFPDPDVGIFFTKQEVLEEGSCIEAAFRRYFHRADPDEENDSYEILACHGNVIRYFVCRALQFPPQGWLRMSIAHGSITWIVVRYDGKVILRCLGDIGHLPPDLVTFR